MRDKVEKIIIEEIKYQLDEIDFDSMFDEKKIKQIVDTEVHDLIIRKLGEMIQASIVKGIQKKYPIIDAFIANKITAILIEMEKI